MNKVKFANIASKLLLAGLFIHYLLYSDLPQYQHKGMSARLVIYPLIVMSVFIIWRLLGRRRHGKPYPHLADLFITLPFMIDTLGNTLNLFDRIEWWDDLMHLILWAFWVMAIGCLLRAYTKLSKTVVAGLCIGFGAVSSIIWELAEYQAFVPNNPMEGPTAYRDTMGDELLSLLGSIVGAILIYTIYWRIAKKRA